MVRDQISELYFYNNNNNNFKYWHIQNISGIFVSFLAADFREKPSNKLLYIVGDYSGAFSG